MTLVPTVEKHKLPNGSALDFDDSRFFFYPNQG